MIHIFFSLKRFVVFGGLVCLLLSPLSLKGGDITIRVAATADVHARLFSYDFLHNRPAANSLANVHHMVSNFRSRGNQHLILLDNGDLLQGTPAAYYANFVQDTEENLFSRVMNFIGYDAATIGNHDIEAGPDVYNRLKNEFDFPWLGANVLDKETGEPYFAPYVILERQRVRIAVLGLTTTGVPTWLPPHLWKGLEFQDMVAAASYWIAHIQKEEQPDAIIGLFHSGFGPLDPDPGDHPLEHASAYIAKTVPGFDLIFSSHDHRRRLQTVINTAGDEVLVMGPGHFAEYLAVAELRFSREGRRSFTLTGVSGDMISTGIVAPGRDYVRAFEEDVQEILAFANQRIATSTKEMHSIDALFGSAPFTDLVHELQLSLTQADISFTAPLAFDATVKAGPMHMRDFFRLYEYENYLYTMELSGQEVRDYLEYSYALWFNEMTDEGDHLLLLHRDALGRVPANRRGRSALIHPPYNFDSAAGIQYIVDVSQSSGERVTILGFEDGRVFEPDSMYKVAVNSYRGSGGGGHLTEGAGIPADALGSRMIHATEKDLRSYMIDYFREMKTFTPARRGNWSVVPESWHAAGREKDMPVLKP